MTRRQRHDHGSRYLLGLKRLPFQDHSRPRDHNLSSLDPYPKDLCRSTDHICLGTTVSPTTPTVHVLNTLYSSDPPIITPGEKHIALSSTYLFPDTELVGLAGFLTQPLSFSFLYLISHPLPPASGPLDPYLFFVLTAFFFFTIPSVYIFRDPVTLTWLVPPVFLHIPLCVWARWG